MDVRISGHQIDTGVGSPSVGPFAPQPDMLEIVLGVSQKVAGYQSLEQVTDFSVAAGVLPELLKNRIQGLLHLLACHSTLHSEIRSKNTLAIFHSQFRDTEQLSWVGHNMLSTGYSEYPKKSGHTAARGFGGMPGGI